MRRILVMLLCGILLLSAFAGCANNEQQEQESTTGAQEEAHWISPKLETTDEFAGNTLTLLVNREMDAGSDEASSDPLEDAVYRRNDRLQTEYGIKFNNDTASQGYVD